MIKKFIINIKNMLKKINDINDKEAELYFDSFVKDIEIIDQDGKGMGKVVSMENGICTIEFKNGYINKYQHHLFDKNKVKKIAPNKILPAAK